MTLITIPEAAPFGLREVHELRRWAYERRLRPEDLTVILTMRQYELLALGMDEPGAWDTRGYPPGEGRLFGIHVQVATEWRPGAPRVEIRRPDGVWEAVATPAEYQRRIFGDWAARAHRPNPATTETTW